MIITKKIKSKKTLNHLIMIFKRNALLTKCLLIYVFFNKLFDWNHLISLNIKKKTECTFLNIIFYNIIKNI